MTDDSGGDGSDGSDGGQVVERKAAEEAFELLSNDTRLGILEALFQTDDPRTFSELREAVGMRDSGQFNYHLDKLLGTFVRVTEEGYELTTAGTRVVGAILAGEFTKTFEGDPVPVDGECQLCGAQLAGIFEGNRIRIACEDCERDVISLNMLPGALEPYPREEWPLVAERWTRRELEMVRAGFCPTCRGPVDSEMTVDQSDLVDLFEAVGNAAVEAGVGGQPHGARGLQRPGQGRNPDRSGRRPAGARSRRARERDRRTPRGGSRNAEPVLRVRLFSRPRHVNGWFAGWSPRTVTSRR
ncbi:hypothetical protein BRC66_03955 [Halobacteriales archaeon QH_2_66_30]|nr:MAG: hypothetical protein BRC66_03955 [Halobacteriales archaeon QH_2_66_30]